MECFRKDFALLIRINTARFMHEGPHIAKHPTIYVTPYILSYSLEYKVCIYQNIKYKYSSLCNRVLSFVRSL